MKRLLARSGTAFVRGVRALALAVFVAGAAQSCGARSELLPVQEPCGRSESERDCATACGSGRQSCRDGHWQQCEVPVTTRACNDRCGTGSQTCEQGVWSACLGTDSTRGCSNDCGVGVQRCSRDSWGVCEVPRASVACSDLCGAGEKICENGAWGACVVPPQTQSCSSVCGSGKKTCQGGSWSACDAPQPKPPALSTILRDFNDTHPDFERHDVSGNVDDRNAVLSLLGSDDTPAFAHSGPTRTITSPDSFYQWYHDVPGINKTTRYSLQLEASSTPGLFVFKSNAFFPLDGNPDGFGNQGRSHDYHFTLATRFHFRYVGGEVFRFTGDDDLWVFVNRHLAIDLGGVHRSESGQVYLDEHASAFGLKLGELYDLHLFFAERHTVDSNFAIETSIADPGSCP